MGFFFESWLPAEDDETRESSLKVLLENGWVDLSADVQVMQATGGSHKYSIVYLHGFTCEGYGYLAEPEYFYRAQDEDDVQKSTNEKELEPFPGLKVILPSAPKRSITAHKGEENYAWYDYLTDHDGKCEDTQPMEEVEEQSRRIHALLDAEAVKVGARNVFLGGASQGCCQALHAGLTYPGELGAIIGCMGHVLSPTPITPEWVARQVPVYCYIGLKDTTMPWHEWVKPTWDRVEDAGGKLTVVFDDEADHGESEDQWLRHFFAEVLN
jgi:phospholipase/carboxylesterase